MSRTMAPKAGISQSPARVSGRLVQNTHTCSASSSTAEASSKDGTSATPDKDRLSALILPEDAKPRQIRRVRVATIFDRSCKKEIARENWSATNPAIASRLKQDEKFVRRLRDTRNPIEVADLYELPIWAVEDLIDDVMAARGIKR